MASYVHSSPIAKESKLPEAADFSSVFHVLDQGQWAFNLGDEGPIYSVKTNVRSLNDV